MQGGLDRHDIPIRGPIAASSQHIPGNMTIATTKAVTALRAGCERDFRLRSEDDAGGTINTVGN